MDPLAALHQSRLEFEQRLAAVADDQWDDPTPCDEWTVRDLANHMLLGTRMTVQLLAGGAQHDVIAGLGDDLMAQTDDPVGTFGQLADEMERGFSAPNGLEGTVNHPMGELPRSMFVLFRVTDNAMHAWDLARALGADERLDEELVDHLWQASQPMADGLADTGMFGSGASGTLGDDAPLQDRLLDMMGRRP
jgi:uncharacterized protein (TIGR03086 family)